MNVSAELARFAATQVASPGSLDPLKKSVMDVVGCIVIGQEEPVAAVLRRVVAEAGGPAPVIGSTARASWFDSALIAGTAAHALDLDDYDIPSGSHPAVSIVPACLLAALEDGRSGEDVLAGIAVGYEVLRFLALGIRREAYQAGQHATGTLGSIAAAAAAGRVVGLTEHEMHHLLGIAASQASGNRANFGSMAKPLQAGNAARAGLLAARLAANGFTGGEDAITGQGGFVQLATGPVEREAAVTILQDAVPRLGHLLDDSPPSLKLHASCGSTHAAIDAGLRLRDQLGPLEDVERIVVELPRRALSSLFYSRPRTGLEAKFSQEHSLALALVHGDAGPRRFSEREFMDATISRLRERVEVVGSDELDRLRDELLSLPARLTVFTANGQHELEVRHSHGSAGDPLEWDEVERKYEQCAARLPDRDRRRLADQLRVLETCATVDELVELTIGSRDGDR